MDLSDILEKIGDEKASLEKHLAMSCKISKEATPYFEAIGAVNWFFYFLDPKDERFVHVGATEKKYDNVGLEQWGKHLLMNDCQIYKEYNDIEKCLNNISNKWLCLMEINDQLIILSNIEKRSNMISLLSI